MLFIPPHTDPNASDLLFFATMTRESITERWLSPTGLEIVEKRGISLQGENLSGQDLGYVDFFHANLRESVFTGANLINTYLSECDIRGTVFDQCLMDRVLIDNTQHNAQTSFLEVDLGGIDFTLADSLLESVHG